MKKGWKIFWILCAVLAVMGAAFCVAGVAMGATLQSLVNAFDNNYVSEIREELLDKSIAEIDELDEYGPSTGVALNGGEYTDVNSLSVEIEKAGLVIQEYDGAAVKVDGSGLNSKQRFSCKQDSSDLEIEVKSETVSSDEGVLYIYIPKDTIFLEVDLTVGGGWLQIESIQANTLDITVGAGAADIEMFRADELNIECGAGQVVMTGEFVRKMELECGVGSVELVIPGNELDYNYALECGIGSICVGDSEYSGLGSERINANGQNRTINVNCGIGEVDIQFTEE